MATRTVPERLKRDEETEAAPSGKRDRKPMFATVCALVALLAGVIGLFFDLAPEYRPDPLDTVGADLAVVAVEPGVTLGAWLEKSSGRDAPARARELVGGTPSASELINVGEMLYVRTQVDGQQAPHVTLAYTVYDRDTQRPVGVPLPPSIERLQRAALVAPSHRSVQLLWMPNMEDEDDVFVRVELKSDRGLLAVTDSAVLRGGMLTR